MRVDSELVSVGSHRRATWALRLWLTALWASGVALFCGAGHLGTMEMDVVCWTPLGLLVGTSILLSVRGGAFAGSARRLSPGSLTIEDGVIEVRVGSRSRTFPVGDVVSGWNELEGREGFETSVLLFRDGSFVRVGCFRHAIAERLLREAGVAPEQRAVKIRVRPGLSAAGRTFSVLATFVAGIMTLVLGLISLVAIAGGAMLFFVIMGAITAGCALVVKRYAPALFSTTLTVGSDGVIVEQLLQRRLVRRAEIVDVAPVHDALLLQLKTGQTLRVPATLEAALVVANRIRDAFGAPSTPGPSLDRLDRAGRPIRAWIAELRGRSGGTLGYREAALPRDELLDLVKDGAAPTERRIAAAVALSGERDPETRVALRLAADTCVDERLRVVLGRAPEMADEDLAEAVAEATLTL